MSEVPEVFKKLEETSLLLAFEFPEEFLEEVAVRPKVERWGRVWVPGAKGPQVVFVWPHCSTCEGT